MKKYQAEKGRATIQVPARNAKTKKPPKDDPQGPVTPLSQATTNAFTTADYLSAEIERLGAVLSPVLTNDDQEAEGRGTPPYSSAAAVARIESLEEYLYSLTVKLRSLNNRIAV